MDSLLQAAAERASERDKDSVGGSDGAGGGTIFQGKRDRADEEEGVSAAEWEALEAKAWEGIQPRTDVAKKNKLGISIMQGRAPYREPRVGNDFQAMIPSVGETAAKPERAEGDSDGDKARSD
jgi:hypothetical protein